MPHALAPLCPSFPPFLPPELLPPLFPSLCVNPTLSSSSAQLRSPGLRSAWPSPQNCGRKINLSAPMCFAFVRWTLCILFEHFLFFNYSKRKWRVSAFWAIFEISCAYSLPDISFLPQSNAFGKKKKKKSFTHYPCFDSFNAEFFHLSLTACYSGNIMDFGARETEPSSSTYWANEILPTSRFACVTEGQECFMGL